MRKVKRFSNQPNVCFTSKFAVQLDFDALQQQHMQSRYGWSFTYFQRDCWWLLFSIFFVSTFTTLSFTFLEIEWWQAGLVAAAGLFTHLFSFMAAFWLVFSTFFFSIFFHTHLFGIQQQKPLLCWQSYLNIQSRSFICLAEIKSLDAMNQGNSWDATWSWNLSEIVYNIHMWNKYVSKSCCNFYWIGISMWHI